MPRKTVALCGHLVVLVCALLGLSERSRRDDQRCRQVAGQERWRVKRRRHTRAKPATPG